MKTLLEILSGNRALSAEGVIPFRVSNPLVEVIQQLRKDLDGDTVDEMIRQKFKLNYPKIWIEVERELTTAGCLLEQTDDPTKAKMEIFLYQQEEVLIHTKGIFDINALSLCYTKSFLNKRLPSDFTDTVNNNAKIMMAWCITLLAILNDTKLVTITSQDVPEALRKAREKRGQSIRNIVKTLDIALPLKRKMEQADREEAADHNRLHWRRGHFKHRRTGIFWWNCHLAGKGEGTVTKDYSVSA